MNENLRYKTLQNNSYSVVRQIDQHRLVVYPDFKDHKPWGPTRKSRYIESIILGIPSQPIWCEETPIGSHLIIDGSQRIEALYEFLTEQFALTGLKIRREYNGLRLKALPYHEIVNIEDRYQIPFIVVNYDTRPDLKCEFYARLFEGERNHKSQAARNFGYRDALRFLKIMQEYAAPHIEFHSSAFRKPAADRYESKIDEVFLHLILFSSMGDNSTYIPAAMTVEDLLDSLMARLAEEDSETHQWGDRALTRLKALTVERGPIQVSLNPTLSMSMGVMRTTVSQFYKTFLGIQREAITSRYEMTLERVIQPASLASRLFQFLHEHSTWWRKYD